VGEEVKAARCHGCVFVLVRGGGGGGGGGVPKRVETCKISKFKNREKVENGSCAGVVLVLPGPVRVVGTARPFSNNRTTKPTPEPKT
jgi:hypothetical protein